MCFVFKQKTAYEMRISDWSSDVCSSDLEDLADGRKRKRLAAQFDAARDLVARDQRAAVVLDRGEVGFALGHRNDDGMNALAPAIGRASCRERVCQYV